MKQKNVDYFGVMLTLRLGDVFSTIEIVRMLLILMNQQVFIYL